MELSQAIQILKERIEFNKETFPKNSYESDFDKFVKTETEAIETVLNYIEENKGEK